MGKKIVFEAISCLAYQFLERWKIYEIYVTISTSHGYSATVKAECDCSTS